MLHHQVESYSGELTDDFLLSQDVNGTGRAFAAIVVTQLLPKEMLFRLNTTARQNSIVFLMALTSGVTASLFSDFGTKHTITDETGQPPDEVPIKPIKNTE